MKVALVLDGEPSEVEIDLERGTARVGGRDLPVKVLSTSGPDLELEIAGERVKVSGWPPGLPSVPSTVVVDGERYEVRIDRVEGPVRGPPRSIEAAPRPVPPASSAPSAAEGAIVPPMPGKVIEVRVSEGETVARGQCLLVLEAMKMRNEVLAPIDGVVRGLRVKAGSNVSARETMLSVVPKGD